MKRSQSTPLRDAPGSIAGVSAEARSALSICLVSAAYRPYPSGVGEHVSRLADALIRAGHKVRILTTHFPGVPPMVDGPAPVRRFGRAIRVPGNGSYATLPVGRHLPTQVHRYFQEHEFDIVHCHGFIWPEISYWAIRHSRAPVVVSLMSSPSRLVSIGAGLFRHIFKGQLVRIKGRIAISERAWRAFEPYVGGDCRIIPCGVDCARFHPDQPPLPESGARGGAPTILFVGRLDQRKGIGVLLEAMPSVLERIPAAQLIVVGRGPELGEARSDVARLGLEDSVLFVGRASGDDLPRYYSGADVFCSPALGGEAQGIVLVEAMASGAAVVASRIPGYDETVRSGVDGLLCEPGDPDELSEAIARILSDEQLRTRLTSEALERVSGEYAMSVVTTRTLDYYRELIAEGSVSAG